jgi:hypothetical protein
LERITEYESDDDSVPTLKPLPDYESDDDDDSIVEHLPLLAPAPIVDKHNTRELLATDTATIQVQPIPKQEIDYRPEIVIAIPRDPQGRNSVFLRALIDSGSNKSHGKLDKMPKWIREQAIPTADQAPFIGWGSEFKAEKEVLLPFKLTQFAPNRKIQHSVLLSEANTNSPTSPDLILGRDLIRKLGLELNFRDETPAIIWDDVAVPMVPRGHWTPARIDEAFAAANEPPSALKRAEDNFDNKSPSMLAAEYHEVKIDDMLPTHLNRAQRRALWHVLKKHAFLFSGKLGKLPGKPVHLELTDPNVKPYHGKAYQVPRSLLPLLKTEVDRLCKIGVLRRNNDSEWAAQGFGVPKKNNQIRFVTDF